MFELTTFSNEGTERKSGWTLPLIPATRSSDAASGSALGQRPFGRSHRRRWRRAPQAPPACRRRAGHGPARRTSGRRPAPRTGRLSGGLSRQAARSMQPLRRPSHRRQPPQREHRLPRSRAYGSAYGRRMASKDTSTPLNLGREGRRRRSDQPARPRSPQRAACSRRTFLPRRAFPLRSFHARVPGRASAIC